MSPPVTKVMLQRFKRNNAIETHNGIMFDWGEPERAPH